MEKSFSSTMPIADESDVSEAQRWIYGAVHQMANDRGISISPEQVVRQTTFGVVHDGSIKKLQGVLTID